MSNKKVLKYLIVITSLLAFVFIEVINNYKLEGVAANFLGMFPLNFVFWLVSKSNRLKQILLIPVYLAIGFILYEFIQLQIPWQTFDVNDIYVTLISMIICMIINYLLVRFQMNFLKSHEKHQY